MSIPKIIWQTYKTKREDLFTISNDFDMLEMSKKWENLNPKYEYRYLDDIDLDEYVFNNDKELYLCIKECDRIENGAMKADIFRYLALYNEGGFYADTDTIPWRPIDDWYNEHDNFLVAEEVGSGKGDTLSQHFFGAKPGHPILYSLIEDIKNIFKNGIDYSDDYYVHKTTGPQIFAKHVFNYKNNIDIDFHIYHTEYLSSIDPNKGNLYHYGASMNAQNKEYKSWRDTKFGRYSL